MPRFPSSNRLLSAAAMVLAVLTSIIGFAGVADASPITAPGAPTLISASSDTSSSSTVVWSAPGSTGGAPINGYTVTATPASGPAVTKTAGKNATTTLVTGLTNGTTYTITVTAKNWKATSVASNSIDATPPPLADVPGSVTAIGANRAINVAWTAPTSDGGSPITGYTATALNFSGEVAGTCTTTTALRCSITAIRNARNYTVTVFATNGSGNSVASSPITARTTNGIDCTRLVAYANLKSCDLTAADLSGWKATGTNLIKAVLWGVNFNGADLTTAKLSNPKYPRGLLASGGYYIGANLSGIDFNGTNDRRVDLAGIDFTNADLSGADLRYSDLSNTNFTGANLTGARLQNSRLTGVNFTNANLTSAGLNGLQMGSTTLLGANFHGASIGYSHFGTMDLTGVDFTGVEASGADFWGCDLSGFDFTGAYFDYATLTNVNFTGANLTNVRFDGANLNGANLTGATITGANFSGASLAGTIGYP